MDVRTERDQAVRLLAGLEDGTIAAGDAASAAEQLDPVLVHAIINFLRRVYPASDPAAQSVLERVVEMMSRSRVLVRKHQEGEDDPITIWFESEFGYESFRGRGAHMIEKLSEKIDT